MRTPDATRANRPAYSSPSTIAADAPSANSAFAVNPATTVLVKH
jgi:hypothetical protein